jgi:Lon protease-like protein
VERDKVLASSTLHAYDVVRSLKENELIRKRWKFTVKEQNNPPHGTELIDVSNSLPLFTLKTPLQKGANRNLNLFEPRWLSMIDEVTNGRDSLDEKMFGCVRCTNKYYSAVSVNGVEGRYADVIFGKLGTFAKIKQIREGKRSVSGDRKVSVSIEGGESFLVDASSLSISSDGYMVATPNVKPNRREEANYSRSSKEISKEKIRLVVVVGLLHGNGVVDLLSKV